jgi:hypothetical protein
MDLVGVGVDFTLLTARAVPVVRVALYFKKSSS